MSSGTRYPNGEAAWLLYIVECCDGSLYTGITNNLDRRLKEHNDGSASRYTRSRRPVTLRYQEPCDDRSQALIRELSVKRLSRQEKKTLIRARSLFHARIDKIAHRMPEAPAPRLVFGGRPRARRRGRETG